MTLFVPLSFAEWEQIVTWQKPTVRNCYLICKYPDEVEIDPTSIKMEYWHVYKMTTSQAVNDPHDEKKDTHSYPNCFFHGRSQKQMYIHSNPLLLTIGWTVDLHTPRPIQSKWQWAIWSNSRRILWDWSYFQESALKNLLSKLFSQVCPPEDDRG